MRRGVRSRYRWWNEHLMGKSAVWQGMRKARSLLNEHPLIEHGTAPPPLQQHACWELSFCFDPSHSETPRWTYGFIGQKDPIGLFPYPIPNYRTGWFTCPVWGAHSFPEALKISLFPESFPLGHNSDSKPQRDQHSQSSVNGIIWSNLFLDGCGFISTNGVHNLDLKWSSWKYNQY